MKYLKLKAQYLKETGQSIDVFFRYATSHASAKTMSNELRDKKVIGYDDTHLLIEALTKRDYYLNSVFKTVNEKAYLTYKITDLEEMVMDEGFGVFLERIELEQAVPVVNNMEIYEKMKKHADANKSKGRL